MKKSVVIFLSFFIFSSIFAQNNKIVNSSISFKIKNTGISVEGKLKGLKGLIQFNPNDTRKSIIEVSVDANTINTGITLRDNHLKKADYFNVATFPEIKMKSTMLAKLKDGSFTSYFNLTLKGITKQVTVPFTFKENTNGGILTGTFIINRRDFTVGGKAIGMSETVTLILSVELTK